MSILEQVHTGRKLMPPRIMLYGVEGVGKSSWAAGAPKPIFIPTEDGLSEIDCASFPLAKKLVDVQAYLEALAIEQHNYETVVLDSLDWLELLIWKKLCADSGVDSIEKYSGGFGKGYVKAAEVMRGVLEMLDSLRTERNLLIVLIAHARVERFEDPESAAYDRYSPRLNKHINSLVTEWADAVLFATRKFRTKSEETGFGRERTIAIGIGDAGGERIVRTTGGPSCVAKNRYSLPFELPLSWPAFMDALTANHKLLNNEGENSNG